MWFLILFKTVGEGAILLILSSLGFGRNKSSYTLLKIYTLMIHLTDGKNKHESYSRVCSTVLYPDQNEFFNIYKTSIFSIFCVVYFRMLFANQ